MRNLGENFSLLHILSLEFENKLELDIGIMICMFFNLGLLQSTQLIKEGLIANLNIKSFSQVAVLRFQLIVRHFS